MRKHTEPEGSNQKSIFSSPRDWYPHLDPWPKVHIPKKSPPSTILHPPSFTIRLQNESRKQVCHQQHLRRWSCETSSSFACQKALQLGFWHFTVVVKFKYPSNHHHFWCFPTFSLFFWFWMFNRDIQHVLFLRFISPCRWRILISLQIYDSMGILYAVWPSRHAAYNLLDTQTYTKRNLQLKTHHKGQNPTSIQKHLTPNKTRIKVPGCKANMLVLGPSKLHCCPIRGTRGWCWKLPLDVKGVEWPKAQHTRWGSMNSCKTFPK